MTIRAGDVSSPRGFTCGAEGSAITSTVGADIAKSRITCQTEIVPGYCTCGAKLPEDARFCHKCGKPQRDEPLLAELAAPPPPPPQPAAPPPPPPISFRNRAAVRSALLSGVLAVVL